MTAIKMMQPSHHVKEHGNTVIQFANSCYQKSSVFHPC